MLKITDVKFGYKFRPILDGVSFVVKTHELIHIIGPNGCGKTTLMGILAGLIKETSGTISLEVDAKLVTDRRLYTEYLPAEANALYGKMDAMENLRFWLKLRGLAHHDQLIIDELERWNLAHPLVRQSFPVEKFSTGMKRRLALARVALSRTPLWLLDEPLYGLDTRGIEQFQAILKGHLELGGSAVVVSHDVEPLKQLNPQVYEIRKAGNL